MDKHQDAVLKKCDLVMVRDEIADMHRMFNAQAEKEGGKYIFPAVYAIAWQAFRDNPSIGAAAALLENAPQLLEYFEMCCPGHSFYVTARLLKDQGL